MGFHPKIFLAVLLAFFESPFLYLSLHAAPGDFGEAYLEAGKKMQERGQALARKLEIAAYLAKNEGRTEDAKKLLELADKAKNQGELGEEVQQFAQNYLDKVKTTYGRPELTRTEDVSGVKYDDRLEPDRTVACVGPKCHNAANDNAAEYYDSRGIPVYRYDGTVEDMKKGIQILKQANPNADTLVLSDHGSAENGGSIGPLNTNNLAGVASVMRDGNFKYCLGDSCLAGAGMTLGPALAQESGAEVSLATKDVFSDPVYGHSGEKGALLKTWAPGDVDVTKPVTTPTLTQFQQLVHSGSQTFNAAPSVPSTNTSNILPLMALLGLSNSQGNASSSQSTRNSAPATSGKQSSSQEVQLLNFHAPSLTTEQDQNPNPSLDALIKKSDDMTKQQQDQLQKQQQQLNAELSELLKHLSSQTTSSKVQNTSNNETSAALASTSVSSLRVTRIGGQH
ncbi:MAG: hypothetical protein HY537_01825 [Deltaproteobacteria bacterium]|nr:hypothetical protein [Deltaproteobacteria bacterium]